MIRDLSSRTLHAIRMMGACAALLVASGLAADAAQPAEPAATAAAEKFTYIVVLHDRAPKDGPPDVAEPDIPALGGEVLHQSHNRRVVRMPDAAVRALVAHRGVKYIQRVQSDGKLPGLPQSESVASTGTVEANWAPPTWFSGEYVYDGEGNITQIGTAASPSSDGGGDSYAYDSAGRLVSVVANHGTTHSEKYSYDSFGNLVNTERTAGPSTATPTFTASNRLQGVTYDQVGNVIATEGGAAEYIYDGMNMLRAKITSTGVASYIYTADDERIGVHENGETRWMIRDLEGRVLREWQGNSSWWLWVEDYVHRGGVLAAAEREPAEGGTRHFHVDHLGTARLLTDSNRAKIALHDYFPFGVERTDFRQEMMDRGTDRPEPMKFTGHERDFTGGIAADNRNQLDYMHARYYSPVWGRFLSVDPVIDYEIAMKNPQGWNRYAYVRNNPINKTDPTGRCEDSGKGEGGKRICIQTYIPTKTFGIFRGDNRGAQSNGGTFRTSQTLTLTSGGHGATKQEFKAGISRSGIAKREAVVAKQEVKGTPEGVNVQVKASDGLMFGAAPNIGYNLTLKPTADGGVKVTGTHSGYPALEVWMYQDGQKPQLIYNHDPAAKDLIGGTRAIGQTVTIPEDEP